LLTEFCALLWCIQSCAHNSSWPFQRDSQSLRSEGLQTFGIFETKAAGIGIVEKIDARQGGCIGQCAVEECSTSSCQEETPIASIHRRRAQVYAEPSNCRLGESVQDKALVSQVIDRSRNQVQTPPRLEIFGKESGSRFAVDAGRDQGRHDLDGHLQRNASHHYQSRRVDVIDLTEDDDPSVERLEREDYVRENTELHRKRKLSQAQGATEICPVCNELFPPHV
jgi:hypothetical protein